MAVQWFKTKIPGLRYTINSKKLKVYYARISINGKMVQERLGTERELPDHPKDAAQKLQRLREGKELIKAEREAVEAKRKAEQDARKTFNKIWRLYKHFKPGLKGLVTDDNRYKKHIQPAFGDQSPNELTQDEIDGFRLRLEKSELRPATVKNILELLRRICNYAAEKGHCKPLAFRVKLPSVHNETTESLTPDEIERLLKAINEDSHPQAGPLMLLALFTGMRRSELFRLKWSDLDYDQSVITIRDTKSGRDEITIPMNEAAREVLQLHRERAEIRQAEKKPPKWCFSEFVFPGRSGVQRTDIHKQVNSIKDAAGLPKKFRALHGLRHAYASALASSGQVDLYTLSRLLTHSSTTMTQRYAHLSDERLKKASSVAIDIFNPADRK